MTTRQRLFVSDTLVKQALMAGLGRAVVPAVGRMAGRAAGRMVRPLGMTAALAGGAAVGGQATGLLTGTQMDNELAPGYRERSGNFGRNRLGRSVWEPMPTNRSLYSSAGGMPPMSANPLAAIK